MPRISVNQLQWSAVLFIAWVGLTNSFHYQELLAGIIITGFIVWLTIPAESTARQWSLWGLLTYFPVFLKALVLANIDVAMRVLNPKLPINPGIVCVPTQLTTPYQRLILANSITLTPGTITLEMDNKDVYIHWLAVEDGDSEHHGETIKGAMERGIMRI
ncbi:sodium:proton antiporter [Chromatium weissei]|nr:sodium:proton antiporter [Chromatium weissei]